MDYLSIYNIINMYLVCLFLFFVVVRVCLWLFLFLRELFSKKESYCRTSKSGHDMLSGGDWLSRATTPSQGIGSESWD